MTTVQVGVDTGGTFTDLMAWTDDGRIHVVKVPSTPEDNAAAFIGGLDALGVEGGFAAGDVVSVAHGTTVALNAVLQRKWSPIGLITTRGYRDLIEVARQTVPGDWGAIYTWVKPPRVVAHENVLEVDERTSHAGEELTALDEQGVRAAARELAARGIDAIAVCFVNSYADPSHERRARELIAGEHPDCFVTISSDVLPEFREYERAMTTCLNAVLMPFASEYLDHLRGRMEASDYRGSLLMMKSVGGLARHDRVLEQPIAMAYSGPSAGVLGMAWLARKIGEPAVLTYDMGGTSTDVALVEHGQPVLTTDGMLDIYPMKSPMIDLVSIGAGGGSIATLGTGNRLRVGPESAGADPGPACYGRGGTQPTVTDANLVLGRVPASLIGGKLELDAEAARAAVGSIAEGLGLSLEDAAYGILEIAAFTMAGAVREVSVKRGRDPRDHALFAYGGAGPLHAAQLASLLDIPRIVVPRNPGLGSCIGLLAAAIKETAVQTQARREDQLDYAVLNSSLDGMETRLQVAVEDQGVPRKRMTLERTADVRYVGMASELNVPVPAGTLDAKRFAAVIDAFHDAYQQAYGYSYRGEQQIELVNLRVSATGELHPIELEPVERVPGDGSAAVTGEREVYFGPNDGRHACPLYDRTGLVPGDAFAGPAIVEQYDSTIVVPPGSNASVDGYGNLIVTRGQHGNG